MYVKPNNAGKGMWPRAQTANQKFKQFGKTQDVGGMPALSVLYISTILNSMGGGLQALSPPRFR